MTQKAMIKIARLPEFEKDIKAIRKKYKTIDDDIAVIEKVLCIEPNASPPFSYHIDSLGIETCIIKVRKFASKSFKGRGVMSGFRLIYAYFEKEDRVVFIELYHKNNKEFEDKDRIKANFK